MHSCKDRQEWSAAPMTEGHVWRRRQSIAFMQGPRAQLRPLVILCRKTTMQDLTGGCWQQLRGAHLSDGRRRPWCSPASRTPGRPLVILCRKMTMQNLTGGCWQQLRGAHLSDGRRGPWCSPASRTPGRPRTRRCPATCCQSAPPGPPASRPPAAAGQVPHLQAQLDMKNPYNLLEDLLTDAAAT